MRCRLSAIRSALRAARMPACMSAVSGAAAVAVIVLARLSLVSVDTVTSASVDVRLLTSTTLERLDKKSFDDLYHFSSFAELTNWQAILKLTCFKNDRFMFSYGGQNSIMYLYNPNDDNNHNKRDDGRHVFRNYTWLYSYSTLKLTEDLTAFGYLRVKNEASGADERGRAYRNRGPTFEELFGGLRYEHLGFKSEVAAGRQWLELGRGFVFYDTLDSIRAKARYEWENGTMASVEPIVGKTVGDNWDTGMSKHGENDRLVVAVPGRLDVTSSTFGLDPDKFGWIGIQSIRPYYAQVFDHSRDKFPDSNAQYDAYYFGGQMYGPLYFNGLMYNLEGILCYGHANDYETTTKSPVESWLGDAELLYENDFAIKKYPFPYKLVAGYTVASGDDSAFSLTSTRYGNWPGTKSKNFRGISGSTPLESAAAGLEPGNLRTLHLEGWLTCYESEKYGTVKIGSAFYEFWKTDNRGYIADEDYYTQPRYDNQTSAHAGTEFDGFFTYEWRDWFETKATVGTFIPGAAYPQGANDTSFLLQTIFTFKF